jgi:hypothetical protein
MQFPQFGRAWQGQMNLILLNALTDLVAFELSNTAYLAAIATSIGRSHRSRLTEFRSHLAGMVLSVHFFEKVNREIWVFEAGSTASEV